jgi:hypothetical protein
MKLRAQIILLVLLVSLVPAYYFSGYLQRVLRPRESAGRFFLFMLVSFMFGVIYIVLLVGMIVRIFPLH